MRWIKKNLILNILLLSIGCLLSFILLETLLRVYDPFNFRVRSGKIILPVNQYYYFNNKLIKGIDSIITHKKNVLGFRGENIPQKFDKYLSILTIGGSTTECFYLSDGKTWPDILNKKLKTKFNHIWLNNAGLDGHSTYGHLILMQDYIIKLKPKVAIFLIGGNDVNRKELNRFDRAKIDDNNKSLREIIKVHSEIYNILSNLKRYVIAKKLGLAHKEVNLRELCEIDIPDELIQEEIKRLHKEEYLTNYKLRVEELLMLSKNNGIKPILVTQPALYGDGIDELTKVNLAKIEVADKKINGRLAWELLECYNDITRLVGLTNNVLVIDLASKMPKNSRYYYDFYHFTNEGAEKVAEIVFRELYPFLEIRYSQYKLTESGLTKQHR